LELKYSITPNLNILKKLDFCKLNHQSPLKIKRLSAHSKFGKAAAKPLVPMAAELQKIKNKYK
jgi:hypothetical protein